MFYTVDILCNTYHINMAVLIICVRKEAIEGGIANFHLVFIKCKIQNFTNSNFWNFEVNFSLTIYDFHCVLFFPCVFSRALEHSDLRRWLSKTHSFSRCNYLLEYIGPIQCCYLVSNYSSHHAELSYHCTVSCAS